MAAIRPWLLYASTTLISTAGRRKNQRFKRSSEGGSTTRRKGQHRCDVCGGFGHRWYTCKDGNPEDKAALLAESSTEIISMLCRSACASSQPDALSIGPPVAPLQPTVKKKRVGKAKEDKPKGANKTKGANKPKGATKQKQALVPVPPQSPAMCTRSKAPESPTMSTRSKRKILD
ncbi:hypothetical protein PVAP13_2NG115392 [Panicum virgatum]|uniref:Uncharacterized protein n=1 Tax=Panicum virgatum TaxID=38727 RepID=A0A8T0VBD1_PANVG|nr:hypothetical protein PVAP13_2NG115392 [Panicum virgatum]